MQRKLSEIAEIPKILSSTLATVAQTFDKLMPSDQQQPKPPKPKLKLKQQKTCKKQRKCSYDEDALDYELRDVTVGAEEEDAQQTAMETAAAVGSRHAQQPTVKDVTPESDYASEVNYAGDADDVDDETEDNDVDLSDNVDDDDDELTGGSACDDDDDDDADGDDESNDSEVAGGDVAAVCEYRRNYVLQQAAANHSRGHNVNADTASDADNDDDNHRSTSNSVVSDGASLAAERDSDDDDDFLSTTYTWNLRNIPKLRLNDGENVNDNIVSTVCNNAAKGVAANNECTDDDVDDDDDDSDLVKPKKKLKRRDNGVVGTHSAAANCSVDHGAPKFMENLERAWPWADREKIIYKQSTCHLVRRRPLGLVEQRKQLLAKQNLVDTLQRRERQLK